MSGNGNLKQIGILEEVPVEHSKNGQAPSVAQLILLVREGDGAAFEALLEQYKPMIESAVTRCIANEPYDSARDDLVQEATLMFYNSILTYDLEQHEVEFGLYAKICVSNALISQLRVLKKRKAEKLTETSDGELFSNDSFDPTLRVLEQESFKALCSVIRDNLSSFEYRVWQMYMSGMSAKQIGERIGKDDRSVNNAIYRIRKKLRSQLQ